MTYEANSETHDAPDEEAAVTLPRRPKLPECVGKDAIGKDRLRGAVGPSQCPTPLEMSHRYRGINRPDLKTLRSLILFDYGASGSRQTTELGIYSLYALSGMETDGETRQVEADALTVALYIPVFYSFILEWRWRA